MFTITAFQDTIIKIDREQLRLHLHPTDMQRISIIMGGVTRRILGGLWTLLCGIVFTAIYLRTGNSSLLVTGIFFCSILLLFLLLLPDKISKTRPQRQLQRHMRMVSTEEGEVYKSFVIGQMTPEEREQFEAQREKKASHK